MKKIILASGSQQRKKLLALLGLKFKVRKSNVKESRDVSKGCAHLVKQNALKKAQDIASKTNQGVVIGADTVVYTGKKKIILKPRNHADARRILKILFARPQWVYTGIAIIDSKTKKTYLDYEKTKVYMTRLNDKEIRRYHKRVHPFDKAGGFDIEGVGSLFIHRIEGCYTNVIGLPMAKLFKILKKVGINILSLSMVFILSGCASEFNLATRQQESLFYSTEREVKLGERVAEAIEKEVDLVEDVDANERVETILDNIVEVCDRKDLVYFIKIIDEEGLNAASLPGGYIYVFKDLLEAVENDDQLAGVIAHEVGHITARHGVKRLQAAYGAIMAQILAIETGKGDVSAGVSLAINSLFTEYSQKDEFQSDQLAVKYMRKAGYDPIQMAEFLKILKADHEKKERRKFSYWRTHPYISKRIAIVNKEIKGKMEFKEYLNIIQADDPDFSQ